MMHSQFFVFIFFRPKRKWTISYSVLQFSVLCVWSTKS